MRGLLFAIMIPAIIFMSCAGGGDAPVPVSEDTRGGQIPGDKISGDGTAGMKRDSGEKMPAGNPKVRIETTMGSIVVELYQDKAPISVANFLKYVDSGFYDGTIVHRVVKGFVIQAGGLSANLQEKTAMPPIKNEAANGLSNVRGTLSMARTNEIDSGSSHFFINLVDNTRLDHKSKREYGYAVFGAVIEGMDVVDKIAAVEVTDRGGFQNVPAATITITKAARVN